MKNTKIQLTNFWNICLISLKLNGTKILVYVYSGMFSICLLVLNILTSQKVISLNQSLSYSITFKNQSFLVVIVSCAVYTLLMATIFFNQQKRNGYLKTELRLGISPYVSLLARVLACLIYIFSVVLMTLILIGFTVINNKNNGYWWSFVFIPNLYLYFFCFLFLALSFLFLVFVQEAIAILLSLSIGLIMVFSPLVSSKLFYGENKKFSYDDLIQLSQIQEKLITGQEYWNLMGENLNWRTTLKEQYETVLKSVAITEGKDFDAEQFEKLKLNWSDDSYFFNQELIDLSDSIYERFFQQAWTGLVYYTTSNKNSYETILGDTKVGNLLKQVISTTVSNKNKFHQIEEQDPNQQPENKEIIGYFTRTITKHPSKRFYDFSQFIKDLKSHITDPVNVKVINLVEKAYNHFPNTLVRDKSDTGENFNWGQFIEYSYFDTGSINNKNSDYELQDENKEIYETYKVIPGLAIFNNVVFNLLRNANYVQFDREILVGRDPVTDMQLTKTIGVKEFTNLQAQANMFSKVNVFNHFFKMYNEVLEKPILYNYAISLSYSKLPQTKYVAYDFDEANGLNNINNTETYFSRSSISVNKNISIVALIFIYALMGVVLCYLASLIFAKKSKN